MEYIVGFGYCLHNNRKRAKAHAAHIIKNLTEKLH